MIVIVTAFGLHPCVLSHLPLRYAPLGLLFASIVRVGGDAGRKSFVQRQIGWKRSVSTGLVTGPLEIIVLKAEVESTKNSLTFPYSPLAFKII